MWRGVGEDAKEKAENAETPGAARGSVLTKDGSERSFSAASTSVEIVGTFRVGPASDDRLPYSRRCVTNM